MVCVSFGRGVFYTVSLSYPLSSLFSFLSGIHFSLGWPVLTLFSNRLVLVAVYCLMIAHPGFVFKRGRKDRSSAISQQELQEYK